MVFFIGLTGSIASGKSQAASFFKTQNIAVINADNISKSLTAPNTPALKVIIHHFGSSFLTNEGELNRSLLRRHIMNNIEERRWLERYLHPLIRTEIERQCQTIKDPYAILEIPLLIDKKPYPYLNRVLLIESEPELQLKRIIKREHCSMQEALALLAAQPNQALRRSIADDIINNNGLIEELQQQLIELHLIYQRLALEHNHVT